MARTRRKPSNKFVRSDAQVSVIDAAASQQEPPRFNQQGRAWNVSTCPHAPKLDRVAPHSSPGNHGWPGLQATTTHSNSRLDTISLFAPARRTPLCWPEDILMEILSTLWLADLSPGERRAVLRTLPLVCKYWLQACTRIFLASTYVVSARSDLFEPMYFQSLLGDPSLGSITRTYTHQLPAPKSLPTYRHLDISRHLALGYQDTGSAALSGTEDAGTLPASLLRDAFNTFRQLDYMPNLNSIVMEYRAHYETDAAPRHRATFRVVHVDVEYQFPPYPYQTQHWIAEELGLLPTSVSRAVKRTHLFNTLPDLNLVSFTRPQSNADHDDPIVLQAIGDVIAMGAGSVNTSKVDDGRFIRVNVHGGLRGLGGRFALVHGAMNKSTCVANYLTPTPQPPHPLPRRRRQSMSFQYSTSNTLPPVPFSVKGTALALIINLGGGGEESSASAADDAYVGLREARIFSKMYNN